MKAFVFAVLWAGCREHILWKKIRSGDNAAKSMITDTSKISENTKKKKQIRCSEEGKQSKK